VRDINMPALATQTLPRARWARVTPIAIGAFSALSEPRRFAYQVKQNYFRTTADADQRAVTKFIPAVGDAVVAKDRRAIRMGRLAEGADHYAFRKLAQSRSGCDRHAYPAGVAGKGGVQSQRYIQCRQTDGKRIVELRVGLQHWSRLRRVALADRGVVRNRRRRRAGLSQFVLRPGAGLRQPDF
jgi:hypothetical protein